MTLCIHCGHWCEIQVGVFVCDNCLTETSPFDGVVVPYQYGFPVDKLIQQLKYRERLAVGRLLGELLAREVIMQRSLRVDVLLPVPLHTSRLAQRGFNHAAEVAYWCGRQLGVAVEPQTVARIIDTQPLAGLARAERAQQIRGAFSVSEALAGLRVAIVDDVLTSGATSKELARELRDTGVAEVHLFAVARTPF